MPLTLVSPGVTLLLKTLIRDEFRAVVLYPPTLLETEFVQLVFFNRTNFKRRRQVYA